MDPVNRLRDAMAIVRMTRRRQRDLHGGSWLFRHALSLARHIADGYATRPPLRHYLPDAPLPLPRPAHPKRRPPMNTSAIAGGTDFARQWLMSNSTQLIGLALYARVAFGNVTKCVVSAWYPDCRDWAMLMGDNPSKRPVLASSGEFTTGTGIQFPPGVATLQTRETAINALRRTGYRDAAKRIERPPLDHHTLQCIAFLGADAHVYSVTVTVPDDANASRIVIGSLESD